MALYSKKENRTKEALSNYLKGLEILEALVKDEGGLENYVFLQKLSGEIGDLYHQRKNWKMAENYYHKTIETCANAIHIYNDKASMGNSGGVLSRLGDLYEERKDYANAKIYYQKYYEINQQLLQEEETHVIRANLGIAAYKLGTLPKVCDREKLLEAYHILDRLTYEYPNNQEYQRIYRVIRDTLNS